MLLGFAYQSFFQPGFKRLDDSGHWILLIGLVLLLIVLTLLLLPTTFHRLAHGGFDDEPVYRCANAMAGLALLPFALSIGLNMYVVVKQAADAVTAIVLLSDGKWTTGRDPVGVAQAAGQAKVPIYTVALGTEDGVVTGPGFGGYVPVPPDPETLGAIAQASGGKAFTADNAGKLSQIYKSLGSKLGSKKRKHENTAAFAVASLVLLLGAAATSVRFAPTLP